VDVHGWSFLAIQYVIREYLAIIVSKSQQVSKNKNMHKVCNIRKIGLRDSLPPNERWRSYCADLDKLFTSAVQGGFGNIQTNGQSYGREVA